MVATSLWGFFRSRISIAEHRRRDRRAPRRRSITKRQRRGHVLPPVTSRAETSPRPNHRSQRQGRRADHSVAHATRPVYEAGDQTELAVGHPRRAGSFVCRVRDGLLATRYSASRGGVSSDREFPLGALSARLGPGLEVLFADGRRHRDHDLRREGARLSGPYAAEHGGARGGVHESENDLLERRITAAPDLHGRSRWSGRWG